MGRSLNTLKGSDVTVTPIKLKYSNQIQSSSLSSNNITLTIANNQSFDYNNPSYGDNFLLYRSVQGLYYMNFISSSLLESASAYEWYPQSTAASGTFDNDFRYFPTASDAQVLVISIPRAKYGENIARSTFSLSSSTYNIIDDGNGNLIDALASNIHVGNILYNQGIGIITNVDYLYTLIPVPLCKVPELDPPFPISQNAASPEWIKPGIEGPSTYEYVLSTSSLTPTGAGTPVASNAGLVNFTELSSSTDYYFFLRSKCSATNYSSWVSASFTTLQGLVPFRDGLILELESFTGSNYDGSNRMTSWTDMSGLGNNVYPAAAISNQYYPIYTSSYFSGQPGIYFSGSSPSITGSAMKTQDNLNGLSGSTGITLFVVGNFNFIGATSVVVEYAKSGSDYIFSTGSFVFAPRLNTALVNPAFTDKGNVGTSTVEQATASQSGSYIFTSTADFNLSTRETIVYLNNISGSQNYIVDSNNSGSFEEYKLSIGAAVQDGRWTPTKGYIGAVLVYNKVLTDSERTQVYNFLSSSYL